MQQRIDFLLRTVVCAFLEKILAWYRGQNYEYYYRL